MLKRKMNTFRSLEAYIYLCCIFTFRLNGPTFGCDNRFAYINNIAKNIRKPFRAVLLKLYILNCTQIINLCNSK